MKTVFFNIYAPFSSNMSYHTEFISCTSKDFDEVSNLVKKSRKPLKQTKSLVYYNNNWCIVSIEKVVNPELDRHFEEAKTHIKDTRGSVREVLAFHGTSESALPSILSTGFDPSRNRRSAYGIGTYVAPSASFARNYAQEDSSGDNVLLICRVALGVEKKGSPGEVIDTKQYDYAVDVLFKPNMYVIPYTYAVIPLYVIRFYDKAI